MGGCGRRRGLEVSMSSQRKRMKAGMRRWFEALEARLLMDGSDDWGTDSSDWGDSSWTPEDNADAGDTGNTTPPDYPTAPSVPSADEGYGYDDSSSYDDGSAWYPADSYDSGLDTGYATVVYPPAPAYGLRAGPRSPSTVVLAWHGDTVNTTGYEVRRAAAGQPWTVVGVVGNLTNQF